MQLLWLKPPLHFVAQEYERADNFLSFSIGHREGYFTHGISYHLEFVAKVLRQIVRMDSNEVV